MLFEDRLVFIISSPERLAQGELLWSYDVGCLFSQIDKLLELQWYTKALIQ